MGRPSKLTEPMKVDILRMLAEGIPIREVARRVGVAESTVRGNFSAQVQKVKDVGTALARVEHDLSQLPVSAQRAAITLAERMRNIQEGYATVAERSTKTSVKLAQLAGRIVDDIPDDSLGPEALAGAALATEIQKAANVALLPASNLIAATNKAKGADEPPGDEGPAVLNILPVRPVTDKKAINKSAEVTIVPMKTLDTH